VSATCCSGCSFSCRLFAFFFRRLLQKCQQGRRVNISSVIPTLERKQVLSVVLLECKASTARRTETQGATDISPLLVLGHLYIATPQFHTLAEYGYGIFTFQQTVNKAHIPLVQLHHITSCRHTNPTSLTPYNSICSTSCTECVYNMRGKIEPHPKV